MSIRLRLTLWYSSVVVFVLILFGVVLYSIFSFSFYSGVRNDLKQQAIKIVNHTNPVGIPGVTPLQIEIPDLSPNFYYQYFLQIDNFTTKKVVTPNDINIKLSTDNLMQKVRNKGDFYSQEKVGSVDFMVYNYPMVIGTKKGNQLIGVLQLATSIHQVKESLNLITSILILMILIALVLSSSIGWFLSGRVLKPIHQIIAETDQIEMGSDLDRRIRYKGPNDEIGVLTRKINGMLGRLQVAYEDLEHTNEQQRRFVSDASHELRTPLTTIRGNVDLMRKMLEQFAAQIQASEHEMLALSEETVNDISSEAERMSRLVNELLALARADDGMHIELSKIDIKRVIEETARKAQFLETDVKWQIGDLSALDGVIVLGQEDYLQQLLFIFIENAFKYTEEGYVRISAKRQNDQIGILVEDSGIGMDKEEIPHIFERFYRADVSRGVTSGTGLGLSIAKWIIDEHDGSVEVLSRKGEGTTFIVWLPVCFQGESN